MQAGRRDKALGTKLYCVNVTFSNFFLFPASSVPRTSRRRRERNPVDRCRHLLEDITGDTAGGTLRERRTR
ncbi:unnamed protein product [Staurois parvus]|uniref:Uncharacterized protein n=1 Tax=Staurois parvus TaxID=386267 RepID=A0ABN9CMU2_9NEOB|nr:unnamed protein product [Staurois parvus]